MPISHVNGIAVTTGSTILGRSGLSHIYGIALASGGASTLLTDLISYWKLDEASGTRNDSVGTNHLTDNNTVTSTTGKVGTAAQFNPGNFESLSIADNSSLSTGDISFTVCAWVRTTVLQASQIIVAKHEVGLREFALDATSTNGFRFYINGSTIITPAVAAVNETWYFLVAWHDASANTVNLQVNNGTVQSAGTGGVAAADTTAAFSIGARNYSGAFGYFNGLIDEVGFWKRTLTSDERTALYNSGSGTTHPF